MRGPWTVTRRRVFVCSCSLLSFIVVHDRCRGAFPATAVRAGGEVHRPGSRARVSGRGGKQGHRYRIPDPSSCSETRRKRIYTADSRDPDGAGASACRVYAAAGPAQTPDEREPMTRTAAASPGGSPGPHAPHPIGALRPDTCDASRKPLRVESTLRRSHSISRSTCRADSQRLSSCPLSLSRTRSLPRTRTRRHSQRSRGWCLPG
jgi:hypothetical protein